MSSNFPFAPYHDHLVILTPFCLSHRGYHPLGRPYEWLEIKLGLFTNACLHTCLAVVQASSRRNEYTLTRGAIPLLDSPTSGLLDDALPSDAMVPATWVA